MKRRKRFWSVFFAVSIAILATHIAISQGENVSKLIQDQLKNEYKPVSPLLPSGVTIKPGFERGVGPVVGTAQMVEGDVWVVHKWQGDAYKLKKGALLFTGDTLVTGERSRLNAIMNDKSGIALAPVSKLVIDKSVYDPQLNERSSLLSLLWGRARFIVSKLMKKGTPDFHVKTPTAVCGVRGTDFAVAVTDNGEEFPSAEGKTSWLDLLGTAHAAEMVPVTVVVVGPNGAVTLQTSVGQVVVDQLQAAFAKLGEVPGAPVNLPLSQVMSILNSISPDLAALSMPPQFD